MSNSPLATFTKISPNRTSPRNKKIDEISIHCMAGNMTIESCGNWFAKSTTGASSNYGIGSDGRIGQYVKEEDRSWCTSSGAIDHRAITIEVASTNYHPYKVTDAAIDSLVNLLVDICQRNGIPALLWKGDKNLMGDVSKQNMVVHRWVKNKACPGEYLYSKHGEIANRVNTILNSGKDVLSNMTKDEFEKILDSRLAKTEYKFITNVPAYARPSVQKCLDAKFISGTGTEDGEVVLNLSADLTRMIVILDRAGTFDQKVGKTL